MNLQEIRNKVATQLENAGVALTASEIALMAGLDEISVLPALWVLEHNGLITYIYDGEEYVNRYLWIPDFCR